MYKVSSGTLKGTLNCGCTRIVRLVCYIWHEQFYDRDLAHLSSQSLSHSAAGCIILQLYLNSTVCIFLSGSLFRVLLGHSLSVASDVHCKAC